MKLYSGFSCKIYLSFHTIASRDMSPLVFDNRNHPVLIIDIFIIFKTEKYISLNNDIKT